MSIKLIAATAAAAALMAAAAAPATAAGPKPDQDHKSISVLGWYNDHHHWGYLLNPDPDTCRSLNPRVKPDAFIGNYTHHQAVFYATEDCTGDAAFTVEPGSSINGTEKGATSVKLVDQEPQPRK